MLGVSQIGLSVTTMDDVFLKIGEMVDAQVALSRSGYQKKLPQVALFQDQNGVAGVGEEGANAWASLDPEAETRLNF